VPDLVERYGDVAVTLATVLPMAMPALRKPDGRIFLGLQRHVQSGDFSRDLAVALTCALETEPGTRVGIPPVPGVGPRLQDLLADAPLDVTMHSGFDFWLDEGRPTTRRWRRRWSGPTPRCTRRSGWPPRRRATGMRASAPPFRVGVKARAGRAARARAVP
jgi:hypothetical protein